MRHFPSPLRLGENILRATRLLRSSSRQAAIRVARDMPRATVSRPKTSPSLRSTAKSVALEAPRGIPYKSAPRSATKSVALGWFHGVRHTEASPLGCFMARLMRGRLPWVDSWLSGGGPAAKATEGDGFCRGMPQGRRISPGLRLPCTLSCHPPQTPAQTLAQTCGGFECAQQTHRCCLTMRVS